MPSAWISKRQTASGVRHRVMFRVGGRESVPRYAGSFKTQREATARKRWVDGELAAMRVPNLTLTEEATAVTFKVAAETWRTSRVDVADGTAATHKVNIARIVPVLGEHDVATITAADVAALVVQLHDGGLARESIRKTRATLAMVLDSASVVPNPARDASVKLPRAAKAEVHPPERAHVAAVHRLLSSAYKLVLLAADCTGLRIGELEALTWGDVDEPGRRWRVSQAVAKTRQGRWVPVDQAVFDAVVALVPRDDRDLDGQVFAGFGADRFRTALTRACKAAAVPAFSPHDLRHRRATLWHLAGVPVVEAAAWLGHSPQEHLKTYAHATLADRRELNYSLMLGRARTVQTSVIPPREKHAV